MAAAAAASLASGVLGSATQLGATLGAAKISADAQKEVAQMNNATNLAMQANELAMSKELTMYTSTLGYNKLLDAGFTQGDAALLAYGGSRQNVRKVWTPQGPRVQSSTGGIFTGTHPYTPTGFGKGVSELGKIGYDKLKNREPRRGSYDVTTPPPSRAPSVASLDWDGFNPNWGGSAIGSRWGSLTSTPSGSVSSGYSWTSRTPLLPR